MDQPLPMSNMRSTSPGGASGCSDKGDVEIGVAAERSQPSLMAVKPCSTSPVTVRSVSAGVAGMSVLA